MKALDTLAFNAEELAEIDRYAIDGSLNLWKRSAELSLRRFGCRFLPKRPDPIVRKPDEQGGERQPCRMKTMNKVRGWPERI